MAIIATSTLAAAMVIGINNSQSLQTAIAQGVNPSGNSTAAKEEADEYKSTAVGSGSNTTRSAEQQVKTISPNQSANKEFWINTVHLDGMTNIRVGMKCDTCAQNTPTYLQ